MVDYQKFYKWTVPASLLAAVFCALCIVGIHRAFIYYVPLDDMVNNFVYDVFSTTTSTGNIAGPSKIVVVTVNEKTLSLFPYRSPIERSYLANLIKTIDKGMPQAIAIDILFDQPTEFESDEKLKATIRGADAPITIAWGNADAGLSHNQIAHLEKFAEASGARLGFANLVTDHDGKIRRFSNKLEGSEHLGLAAATYESAATIENTMPEGRITWTTSNQSAQPFTTFSAQAVMQLSRLPNQFVKRLFHDKYVIVGADLPQQDRHGVLTAKSVGQNSDGTIPGVFIHAHILNQLIDGNTIEEVDDLDNLLVHLVAVTIGLITGAYRIRISFRIATLLLVSFSLFFISILPFYMANAFYSIFNAVFLFTVAVISGILFRAGREHSQRNFLRHAFGRYVSIEVLRSLEKDPTSLMAEARRVHVTMLFTDIAKFTAFSEITDPTELKIYLNRYLDGVGDIIIRNNGLIDKFIGDAVVAVFGAPSPNERHKNDALQCAYDIIVFTEKLMLENGRLNPGRTRVGVHSGEAMLGNFGGTSRFDYTAIGDSVNTAARLESANKYFDTKIIFSASLLYDENTLGRDISNRSDLDAVSGLHNTVPIGRIIFAGKSVPILCFTMLPVSSSYEVANYLHAFSALDQQQGGSSVQMEQFSEHCTDRWLKKHSRFLLDNSTISTIISLGGK